MAATSLSVYEAQCFIETLTTFELEEIGTDKWTAQHEVLEKLNLQAHQSAQSKHDEYVVDEIITQNKVGVIIHNLVTIELWKEKILPIILPQITEDLTMKLYIILYNEATLANLLEVILFHKSAIENSDDVITELCDYCNRKMILLNSKRVKPEHFDSDMKDLESETPQQQLLRQGRKIEFCLCASAISILRFITDHISDASISVMQRLLNTNDVIIGLISLIENNPWLRRDRNKIEKFENNNWIAVEPRDLPKLTKLEAQLWLSVYNLTMDTECRKKYEIYEYRKNSLLKLRRHLTEAILDQLPMLVAFRKTIEELSIIEAPPAMESKFFCIEVIPEIRETLLKSDFKTIAAEQMRTIFGNYSSEQRRKDVQSWARSYNFDSLEDMITEDPKCARCGKMAEKRCSRCKLDWYCSRQCQVASWKKHKPMCDLMAADIKNNQKKSQQSPLISELKI